VPSSPNESRTVIICAPADKALDWFTASEILDWHHQPTGTPHVRYPVRRRTILSWITRWRTRHLITPVRHRGAITHAAGGRKHRLDLNAAITAANTEATHRWHAWAHVVRDTPTARPWADYLAQHSATPDKVTLENAKNRFEAQPRILAMLAHNCHPHARVQLDPCELEAYQAGETTYTTLYWQHAVLGDALITTDGRLLQPSSSTLASRLRYLTEAGAYLRGTDRSTQLLAVKIPRT
jgi:hypothetical protein